MAEISSGWEGDGVELSSVCYLSRNLSSPVLAYGYSDLLQDARVCSIRLGRKSSPMLSRQTKQMYSMHVACILARSL